MIAVDSLLAELDAALEAAEPHRRVVSVTAPVDIDDPGAAVFASRLASDRWFCWEQPDSDGFALAGTRLGARDRRRGARGASRR